MNDSFKLTLSCLALLAFVLIGWAVLRSNNWLDNYTGYTDGAVLVWARSLIVISVIAAFVDLQPFAIALFTRETSVWARITDVFGPLLLIFGIIVSLLSSSLGRFLLTSQHQKSWRTRSLRLATKLLVFVAAVALPLCLWIGYLYLTAWMIRDERLFPDDTSGEFVMRFCILAAPPLFIIAVFLAGNGYSLHGFYRDRLSRAFLFNPEKDDPLGDIKLSELKASEAPYQIINTAMNVQGSAEANRRGRNADFFMFTRDFVGSDLTLFAPTSIMEEIEPQLDLGSAMAISGAALSANMGSQTVRLLSPTLALLNVRLGYWLRNPRHLLRKPTLASMLMSRVTEKFYLIVEMLNKLNETSRNIYLTDGGHIENLGVYELLKRGCQLIIVIDAEADPNLSFGSLMRLERYARIDFGVRIVLPFEKIAQTTRAVSEAIENQRQLCRNGPHCAIGRIFYEIGAEGVMLYFNSSLSGDEKDYILDYKKRYDAFPHETTEDQFFSEEQFEVYRALGSHMVNEFLEGKDEFSFLTAGFGAFDDCDTAFKAVMTRIGGITMPTAAV